MNFKKTVFVMTVICLILALTACSGDEESSLIVETDKGTIEGKIEKGVKVFKGVPYAAPPLDELRFAPPHDVEAWDDILECKEFKPSAMQKDKPSDDKEGIKFNEDCLYLNIWAPENAKEGDDLPVLVYIHGGSFSTGSPERPTFNGTKFAKGGVIQVDIEYRVNVFGFSAFEEIEKEYGYLGNAGLLDQIASLKWVQNNIEKFGGNKDNVTVSGESAGSISVSDLLISPEAEGLFDRAIMQSGNTLGQKILAPLSGGDRETAIANTKKLMDKVGAESLEDMQKLDPEILVEDSTYSVEIADQSTLYFLPVYDGKVIPEDPVAAIEAGEVNCDTILLGYNTNEGSMFVPKDTDERKYREILESVFGDNADEVYARFPVDSAHSAYERTEYLITMGLVYGSQVYADAHSNAGNNVYFYNFNYIPEKDKEEGLGATHTAELGYVFDTLSESQRDAQSDLMIEELHNRWLSFVKNGDPNKHTEIEVEWPIYENGEVTTIQFDLEPQHIESPLTDDAQFLKKMLFEN